MTIEYCDVFPILANAVSGFEPAKEDWEEPLPYIFLNDMARFICNHGYSDFDEIPSQFGSLFEKLLTEGDNNVHALTHDALETVWEHKDTAERGAVVRHFGPRTMELWGRICGGEHMQ